MTGEGIVSVFCTGGKFLCEVVLRRYEEDAAESSGLSFEAVVRTEKRICFVEAFLGSTRPTPAKSSGFILGAFLRDARSGEFLGYIHRSDLKRPVDLPAAYAEMLSLETAECLDDDLRILAAPRDARPPERKTEHLPKIAELLDLIGVPVDRSRFGSRLAAWQGALPFHPTIQ